MRVLFITAYFPPCQYGCGYMRICEQVADGLAARGHEVAVLISTYQDGPETKPYPVYRLLTVEPDWLLPESPARQFFFGRREREKTAVTALHQTIATFNPDMLFIWDAFGLSEVMLYQAENQPIPVAYYFANYHPEFPGGYAQYWSSENNSSVASGPMVFTTETAMFHCRPTVTSAVRRLLLDSARETVALRA